MDKANKSLYDFVGFIVSFVIYFCVLLFLAFYLQDKIQKNIKYTTNKNVVLDITLVEHKPVKKRHIVKKVRKRTKKIKKTASKPKVKTKITKSTKKISLQGLFKKVKIKNIKEPVSKKSIPSRKKVESLIKKDTTPTIKDDAQKIVKTLNFDNKKSIISSKDGVYDKFRGEITKILDENWQNTIDTVSGNSATVTVFIDKSGVFSYKIEKLSYNNDFNSKLRDFLEEMRDKEFPPYIGEGIFQIKVEFKDIRQ